MKFGKILFVLLILGLISPPLFAEDKNPSKSSAQSVEQQKASPDSEDESDVVMEKPKGPSLIEKFADKIFQPPDPEKQKKAQELTTFSQ